MNPKNEYAAYALDRAVNSPRGGFYVLIGTPRAQAAAVAGYDGLCVFDYAKDAERKLVEIARQMDAEPEARAYVFLNFQLALWDRDAAAWDHDALRRLNYSRDALARRGQTLIFCMTADADAALNRNAYDFYDYIKLFFRFEDETAETRERVFAALPVDRSTGVDVKVDFSRSDEDLLALAISIGNQARELYEKARYGDALHLFEKQREIREHVLGTEHPDTASTYNNIGLVYKSIGEYQTALEWYQKSLEITEKALGKEHQNTATAYNNIGIVYKSMGEYQKALKWYLKALETSEKVLGREDPDTAKTYVNIGNLYDSMGEYQEALEWHQKALEIFEKVLGKEHPTTAIIYNNIGLVYDNMREHQKALNWYHKALVIDEKVLGKKHPDMSVTYNNIGAVYYHMGEYQTALEWQERALKIKEKVLGIQHPSTIRSYNSIADDYAALGDAAMEQVYRAKAAEAQRKRNDGGESS